MTKRFTMTEAAESAIRADDAGYGDDIDVTRYPDSWVSQRRSLLAELDATRAALADAERKLQPGHVVPDASKCERAIADLTLLQELRAHPALDWHVTDIEGARDAAESPEAREICEMTMKLLGGEP